MHQPIVPLRIGMTQKEAVRALGVTTRTLRYWLKKQYGPTATRDGTLLLYSPNEVAIFADQRQHRESRDELT